MTNTIKLADVARKAKMSPKTARQKFRRAQDADRPCPEPTSFESWEFPAVLERAVLAFLTGTVAKKSQSKKGNVAVSKVAA
jgi:hypothetical protein